MPKWLPLHDTDGTISEVQGEVGNDNSLYILRHDTVNWKWELTFYSRIEDKNEQR